MLEFFITKCILPNFNSNSIMLIPKVDNADTVDQFRPIAMANFKFKILSKVLVDMLDSIMPTIISKEQNISFMEDSSGTAFPSLLKLLIFFLTSPLVVIFASRST